MKGASVDFEQYGEARAAALLRFAYVLTADSHAAEDLVQTVLMDVYRRWGRVSRSDNVDAYVHRMMVNAHTSWRRRRSNTEQPHDPLRGSGNQADIADTQPDVADAVVVRDQAWRVLRGLPPRARAVLALRYLADCDDPTIAEMLHVRPGTVRSIASRAIASLRAAEPQPTAAAHEKGTSHGRRPRRP